MLLYDTRNFQLRHVVDCDWKESKIHGKVPMDITSRQHRIYHDQLQVNKAEFYQYCSLQRSRLPTHFRKINIECIQNRGRKLWCILSRETRRVFANNRTIFVYYHLIPFFFQETKSSLFTKNRKSSFLHKNKVFITCTKKKSSLLHKNVDFFFGRKMVLYDTEVLSLRMCCRISLRGWWNVLKTCRGSSH